MTGASPRRASPDAARQHHHPRVLGVETALYATCLHEYAHLAVARRFGACGFVTIQRIRDGMAGTARWNGRFQLFGSLDDDEWRIVAIAGTLAERLHEGLPAEAALLEAALRKPGALSGCDAALAEGFVRDDVARCAVVLCEAWPAITGDAGERVAEISERCVHPL